MVVAMVMANCDYHSWINLERNKITVNGSFSFDQIKHRKGDGELFRDRLHPAIGSAKDRKVSIEDSWCAQLEWGSPTWILELDLRVFCEPHENISLTSDSNVQKESLGSPSLVGGSTRADSEPGILKFPSVAPSVSSKLIIVRVRRHWFARRPLSFLGVAPLELTYSTFRTDS